MPSQNLQQSMPQLPDGYGADHKPEDLFTLDQRLDAISEILAEITLDSMKKAI